MKSSPEGYADRTPSAVYPMTCCPHGDENKFTEKEKIICLSCQLNRVPIRPGTVKERVATLVVNKS
ncbi:hypothetical protein OUZ56_024908 [Daphnia magna]|uniref:Uncharacterized protein n=1 Tax=Daphnia magna TaxID=35525 RepID=A0ABQ9ZIC7_9CRUS|nr:hypothetical protein OUZ56_024908 [Daphnia magna]